MSYFRGAECTVCPELTVTPPAQSAARAGELELPAKRIPLSRLVLPKHIADAVLFYCSARARMVAGARLDVDCGLSLGMQDMEACFADTGLLQPGRDD